MSEYKRPEQPGDDFFKTLRERYSFGLTADSEDRKEAEHDVVFASGGLNQWDPEAVIARRAARRPILTENRLGPSISQVVNAGRENKPAIQCTPMDGGTEESAEYFQGRIRQVEYECDADVAWDTARQHQVESGRGFVRVTTRYEDEGNETQYAVIEPINNQFSVIWDPGAKRYDLADATWFMVVRDITREEHERLFGSDTEVTRQNFYLAGANPAPDWVGIGAANDFIRVADYYYLDYEDTNEDGKPKVKISITNGVETLEETEWLDSEPVIPVIPLFGLQKVVNGVMRTYSLIRHAKDPQKLVNLYASNIAEQIGQMPKNPYKAAAGQIEGFEHEWETINTVARAVVHYNARDVNGDIVGAPQREAVEPPIQALVTGYLQAVDAVKAATGIFDASLGQRSNETSGLAIHNRQVESDISNFHFSDNEARSRKKLGRILLRILPLLDGTEPGEKPVRDEGGKVRMAKINQPYLQKGKLVHINLADPGKHDIAVSTGPSYTSQRREENERISELIKQVPDLFWIVADLYFATSDGPGSAEMAERMRRAISMRTPGLIEPDQNDPRQQMQHIQQQAQQLAQQNQQLVAEVHKLAQAVETKQAEMSTKERIAALDSWTKLRVAEITAKVETGIADADREGERLEGMFDRAHEAALEAQSHAHTVLQTQQQGDQQQQQAAQQNAFQREQSQRQQAIDLQQQQQDQQQQLPEAA